MTPTAHGKRPVSFLPDGGEMGQLIRHYNWDATSLGPMENWPPSLRTTLSLLLHSAFPMFLFWGDDLLCFYNDAYRPSLGGGSKHPWALGKPAEEVWAETWAFTQPLIQAVLDTGEASWFEDQLVTMHRNGKLEDTWWTSSFSAVLADDGCITGVLVTCVETTAKVRKERELAATQNQLRLAIENVPAAVFLFNNTGTVLLANKAASSNIKKVLGEDYATAIPLSDLMQAVSQQVEYTDEADRIIAPDQLPTYAAMRTGAEAELFMKRRYKQTGEVEWFLNKAVPLLDEEGQVQFILTTSTDYTERVKAEQALKESEGRYRSIFEATDVSFWEEDFSAVKLAIDALKAEGVTDFRAYFDANPDFVEKCLGLIRVTDVNEATVSMFEAEDKAQVLGNLPQIFAADTMPVFIGELLTIAEGRTTYSAECLLRTVKGNSVHTLFTMRTPPPGDPLQVVVFSVLDISSRKLVEDALKESENRFRSLANDTPAFMFMADADTHVEFVNRQWLEFAGLTSEEGFGKAWETITHPDDVAPMYAAYTAAVTTLQPYRFQIRQRRHDGVYRWVLWRGIPRKNANGAFDGVMGVGFDVTEQKEAEQMIRKSEEEFRQLANLVPQIIWTAQPDGAIDYYNKRWYEYTGFPDTGYGDQSWLPILHPDDAQPVFDTWYNSIQNGVPYQIELRLKAADGEFRWFLAKALPVRNEGGHITKWFGTTTDIHEQKTLSEKLEQMVANRTQELARSNQDLQQFAHVASHDLKEPVRKVRTFAGRLEAEAGNALTERSKEYLQKIKNGADRMYAMIDGVLTYSTLDATEQAFGPVSLEGIIATIEADLEVVMQEQSATIKHDALPTVQGVPVLIHQLFYNLVNNSLKFRSAGVPSVINIQTQTERRDGQEWAVITLQDNGIGFEQKQAEKIFDTFTRLHSKDQYEGTGLGLSLCRKIVERHGGTITATSALGQGATFIIQLPVARGQ